MIPIRVLSLALATVLIAAVAHAAPDATDPGLAEKPSRPVLSVQDAAAYEGEG